MGETIGRSLSSSSLSGDAVTLKSTILDSVMGCCSSAYTVADNEIRSPNKKEDRCGTLSVMTPTTTASMSPHEENKDSVPRSDHSRLLFALGSEVPSPKKYNFVHNASAICLQSSVRRHLARKRYFALLRGITLLQQRWIRQHGTRKKISSQKRNIDTADVDDQEEAAKKIQMLFRGASLRPAVLETRTCEEIKAGCAATPLERTSDTIMAVTIDPPNAAISAIDGEAVAPNEFSSHQLAPHQGDDESTNAESTIMSTYLLTKGPMDADAGVGVSFMVETDMNVTESNEIEPIVVATGANAITSVESSTVPLTLDRDGVEENATNEPMKDQSSSFTISVTDVDTAGSNDVETHQREHDQGDDATVGHIIASPRELSTDEKDDKDISCDGSLLHETVVPVNQTGFANQVGNSAMDSISTGDVPPHDINAAGSNETEPFVSPPGTNDVASVVDNSTSDGINDQSSTFSVSVTDIVTAGPSNDATHDEEHHKCDDATLGLVISTPLKLSREAHVDKEISSGVSLLDESFVPVNQSEFANIIGDSAVDSISKGDVPSRVSAGANHIATIETSTAPLSCESDDINLDATNDAGKDQPSSSAATLTDVDTAEPNEDTTKQPENHQADDVATTCEHSTEHQIEKDINGDDTLLDETIVPVNQAEFSNQVGRISMDSISTDVVPPRDVKTAGSNETEPFVVSAAKDLTSVEISNVPRSCDNDRVDLHAVTSSRSDAPSADGPLRNITGADVPKDDIAMETDSNQLSRSVQFSPETPVMSKVLKSLSVSARKSPKSPLQSLISKFDAGGSAFKTNLIYQPSAPTTSPVAAWAQAKNQGGAVPATLPAEKEIAELQLLLQEQEKAVQQQNIEREKLENRNKELEEEVATLKAVIEAREKEVTKSASVGLESGATAVVDETQESTLNAAVPKETSVRTKDSTPRSKAESADQSSQISRAATPEQQHLLMEESGRMLEYLRREVVRLRKENGALKSDFDSVSENTQRLMEANSIAHESFSSLNESAREQRLQSQSVMSGYKQQIHDLKLAQEEMKDVINMKQVAYIAEVRSKKLLEVGMSRVVDLIQEKCRDSRLIEAVLQISDEVEEQQHMDLDEAEPPLIPETDPKLNSSMVGRFTSFFSSS